MRARLGAAAWIAGFVLFFVAQIVVGSAWTSPAYSWSWNNVSDLGNARCQMWAEDGHAASYVCSPLHGLMNAAFVLEGCCVVLGVLATGPTCIRSKIARTLLMIAGLGLVIAGLAPADLHENIHVVLGALPIAVCGNIALLFTRQPRYLGPALGIIGIVCTGLFVSQHYLGFGPGGMERLWGYNFVVWTGVAGVYCFATGRASSSS